MNLFFVVAERTPTKDYFKILITRYDPAYRDDVSTFCDADDIYKFCGNLCIFNTDSIDNNSRYDIIESAVNDLVDDSYEWKFVPLRNLHEYLKPTNTEV